MRVGCIHSILELISKIGVLAILPSDHCGWPKNAKGEPLPSQVSDALSPADRQKVEAVIVDNVSPFPLGQTYILTSGSLGS